MEFMDFVGRYVNVGLMLTGVILLVVSLLIIRLGGDKASDKIAVRVFCAILAAAGVYGTLWSIFAFGQPQALTVGLLILFLGMVWSAGAKGAAATIIGIVLAIIAFAILAAAFRSLPVDSPIGQFLDNSWNLITGLFPDNK